MNSQFLNILNKLTELEGSKVTLKELGGEMIVTQPFATALLLSSISSFKIEGEIFYEKKPVDLDRVIKAKQFYRKLYDENIIYIGIIGDKAQLAYKHLKNKFSDCIYHDSDIKEIILKNEIYIPINQKKFLVHHIDDKNKGSNYSNLSSLGVTVLIISTGHINIYVSGLEVTKSRFYDQSFIPFIHNVGFYLDEYYLGTLLYFISKLAPECEKIILENINSKFIQSLISFNYRSRFTINHGLIEGENDEFNDLVNILKLYQFNQIRNMTFSFVRGYIYGKN